jgi:ATP-binding cassette subfamily F protein 2
MLQVVQMKKYQKEQDDIKHIKEFIASCGKQAPFYKEGRGDGTAAAYAATVL